MQLPLYQVDAFTQSVFAGNPAAICPLKEWLADDIMQAIAFENNLSETAFFVEEGGMYHIRWFTPLQEVKLCGHATLATAYVLYHILDYRQNMIRFQSKSGLLTVCKKEDGSMEMDFPLNPPVPCQPPEIIESMFKGQVVECLKCEDYIVVLNHEESLLRATPDLQKLRQLDLRGVMLTSRSLSYDFVLRFFAPKYGIDEDPVTGSALTSLAPYWSGVLNKTEFRAKQISKRGGEARCRIQDNRVKIGGTAVLFMSGVIHI